MSAILSIVVGCALQGQAESNGDTRRNVDARGAEAREVEIKREGFTLDELRRRPRLVRHEIRPAVRPQRSPQELKADVIEFVACDLGPEALPLVRYIQSKLAVCLARGDFDGDHPPLLALPRLARNGAEGAA